MRLIINEVMYFIHELNILIILFIKKYFLIDKTSFLILIILKYY